VLLTTFVYTEELDILDMLLVVLVVGWSAYADAFEVAIGC
jgi:hypothetical protein